MADISDKEIMGLVIGSVAGFAARPRCSPICRGCQHECSSMGGKGGTRSKFARMLLSTFLTWCVKHGAEAALA